MNKKQLIIAWVIGGITAFIFIAGGLSITDVDDFLGIISVASGFLIIGGLLIYTLRDKKK